MKLSKKDVIKYQFQFLKLSKRIPGIINCGFHSGFPACCVKFYICDWIWRNDEEMYKYNKVIPENVYYIPCPDCIKKNRFVKVKHYKGCRPPGKCKYP